MLGGYSCGNSKTAGIIGIASGEQRTRQCLRKARINLFKKTFIFILSRSMRNYSDFGGHNAEVTMPFSFGSFRAFVGFNYSACCDPKRAMIDAGVFSKAGKIRFDKG